MDSDSIIEEWTKRGIKIPLRILIGILFFYANPFKSQRVFNYYLLKYR